VGYDQNFGARPLKRAIQKEVQDALAMAVLSGKFHTGETIDIARGADGLVFNIE